MHSDLSRTWSLDSPNVLVGLDRVQQYMYFFSFKSKQLIVPQNNSLVPQTGNVIAIGLTPSNMGIVIGRLLNAQLRYMSVRLALSVRAAWRHK